MSLNAGGLAQMTYQPHNSFNTGLGVPGSGFASRRGGSQIKRLSMAPPTNISTIDEAPRPGVDPPRTSRSHLLAGLRTAPKSPALPSSAPPTQVRQPFGPDHGKYAGQGANVYGRGAPQTAVGGSFPRNQRYGTHGNGQMFQLPEILAPPVLQFGGEQDDGTMDPAVYAELVATNQYLAQQQMRLQQQLLNITAAQQQFQGLNLNSGVGQQQQYMQASTAPSNGFYSQQLQNGLQPIVTPVPNTPGVYTVYNPMTGQQGYVVDNGSQKQAMSPPAVPLHSLSQSPPPTTPTFRAQVSPPPENNVPTTTHRSPSPPKSSSPPSLEVNPLPAPSANAFRRGHSKNLPSVTGFASNGADGPKSSVPKSAGFPQTPMTGTFGPGQARAGDHPIRQPRGPPSLEELVEKPTSKHEGSKNFVTRQRRRAVNNLVRAGLERRGASRASNSIDSAGSGTPSSECEITFSISSDNDSDSVGSRSDSLSGKPSLGSLRAAANGAIGSERKEMKARSGDTKSTGTPFTAGSVSSEEGTTIGGKMVEVKMEDDKDARRKAPLLVLTSAEKRKSAVF